jgi:hypothetical protein
MMPKPFNVTTPSDAAEEIRRELGVQFSCYQRIAIESIIFRVCEDFLAEHEEELRDEGRDEVRCEIEMAMEQQLEKLKAADKIK